jgi:hypothetical protein
MCVRGRASTDGPTRRCSVGAAYETVVKGA